MDVASQGGPIDVKCPDPIRVGVWPQLNPSSCTWPRRKWTTTQDAPKKSVRNKWWWNIILHKHNAQKMRLSCGQSSRRWWQWMDGAGESQWRLTPVGYFHCGSQFVESVEHMFFNCPLTQQMWRYVANMMWQLFAKVSNLSLLKIYFFNEAMPLWSTCCKTLKQFTHIRFFLKNGLSWNILVPTLWSCFSCPSMACGEETPSGMEIFAGLW